MSKLFEQFVNEVFNSNPHIYQEAQRLEAEIQEARYYAERNKCNPIDNTLEEWQELGQPKNPKL